jgi:membrane protein required for colicin V production
MPPFNWFDAVIVIILLSSVFAGLRAGLARVVVGLVATVVGFLAAFWCYRIVAAKLADYVPSPAVANILGFLAILLGTLILGALVGALLSYLLKWIGLSWLNHAMGGVAGAIRGILLVAVIADALIAFSPSPPPQFLNNSRLLPYATQLGTWLADAAPRDLKDAFDAQRRSLQRLWNSEQFKRSQEI